MRTYLLAVTAAILLAATSPAHAATPAPDFRESVGVNTHFTYSDTRPYNTYNVYQAPINERTGAKIAGLGIRYLRDGYPLGNPRSNAFRPQFVNHGLQFDVGCGDSSFEREVECVNDMMTRIGGDAIVSFEGINEPNCAYRAGGWGPNSPFNLDRARANSARMADAAHAVGEIALPASICWVNQSQWTLDRETGQYTKSDLGNAHNYTGGKWLTAAQAKKDFDSWRALVTPRGETPTKGVMATEWGYHTGVPANQPGVTEIQQRQRTMAGLLTNMQAGFGRVYIYEFADLWSSTGQEGRWGLLRNDLTDKPVAVALRNTIAMLGGGARVQKPDLALNVSDPAGAVRTKQYVRDDGSFWAALYQEKDTAERTVTLTRPYCTYSWMHFKPWVSTVGLNYTTTAGNTYRVTVGNDPVWVRIKPCYPYGP